MSIIIRLGITAIITVLSVSPVFASFQQCIQDQMATAEDSVTVGELRAQCQNKVDQKQLAHDGSLSTPIETAISQRIQFEKKAE